MTKFSKITRNYVKTLKVMYSVKRVTYKILYVSIFKLIKYVGNEMKVLTGSYPVFKLLVRLSREIIRYAILTL